MMLMTKFNEKLKNKKLKFIVYRSSSVCFCEFPVKIGLKKTDCDYVIKKECSLIVFVVLFWLHYIFITG